MILTTPPGQIGMKLDEVDTPALILDLDVFEANLAAMTDSLDGYEVNLRPHAKSHKSAIVAQRQMAAGAIGQCCQKVGEAEVLVHGGIGDVLVTNQIVGRSKVERLVALAKQAKVAVLADHPDQITQYAATARDLGTELNVLVEINLGSDRCGVEPGRPALELARLIVETEGVAFGGLQAYHGGAQHLRTRAEREAVILPAAAMAEETGTMLLEAGIPCPVITGAGTGTYLIEAAGRVFTELQPGSYVFMDLDYGRILDQADRPITETFGHSLTVLVTVISRGAPTRAVVDAGHKTIPIDSGLPRPLNRPGVEYNSPSDEHGVLGLPPEDGLAIGDKLRLIPPHCDPVVNMFDWYVCVRQGRVEAIWPIGARGANR